MSNLKVDVSHVTLNEVKWLIYNAGVTTIVNKVVSGDQKTINDLINTAVGGNTDPSRLEFDESKVSQEVRDAYASVPASGKKKGQK